jgi:microcystin-dependent protein
LNTTFFRGDYPLIGEIRVTAGSDCGQGWTVANGALYSPGSYPALFNLLSATYGGDGRSSFALPDLRGRAIIGTGKGPSFTYALGDESGAEKVKLNQKSLPSHTHAVADHDHGSSGHSHETSFKASAEGPTVGDPKANSLANWTDVADIYADGEAGSTSFSSKTVSLDNGKDSDGTPTGDTSTAKTKKSGGTSSIQTNPPSLPLTYCICISCNYPSQS